jgi:hypothetical protein
MEETKKAPSFTIKLDDKPHLLALLGEDASKAREVIGTFVNLIEQAAKYEWYKLPEFIHSSITFPDLISGILEGILTVQKYPSNSYLTLEQDVHPLSLLSDTAKDEYTKKELEYNWRDHFTLKDSHVSKETIAKIYRELSYLVRWFDLDSIRNGLFANDYPVIDNVKGVAKLPFFPSLRYQKEVKGELHVGQFLHEVGLFDCGEVAPDVDICLACQIGELETITNHEHIKGCRRCNSGFIVKEGLDF